MVADLRARLADELEEHYPTWSNDCGCGEEIGSARWQAEHVADVLLALPGIAIMELPHGQVRNREITRWSTQVGQVTRWLGLVQHSHGSTWRPSEVRVYAAALLAAAQMAEQSCTCTQEAWTVTCPVHVPGPNRDFGLFCPIHHAWHPGPVCDPQEAP